jgi:hypothetical protein
MMGTAFTRFPLPGGVPMPMCFFGDACKVAKSDEEETYNQRYWMCDNFAFDPTPRQIRIGLMVTILFSPYEIMCVLCAIL